MSVVDYGELSMLELFKLEAETQTRLLTTALLALENDAASPRLLEACMRASHSLKGAARIVGLTPGVSVTHAMEDCFVAAQNQRITLTKPLIDRLLEGVDWVTRIAAASEAELVAWSERDPPGVEAFVGALKAALAAPGAPAPRAPEPVTPAFEPAFVAAQPHAPFEATPPSARGAAPDAVDESGERALRVSAQNFNRLLGLAAQSLVESRQLAPLGSALLALKRQHDGCARALAALRDALPDTALDERAKRALSELGQRWRACRATLGERIEQIDAHHVRVSATANRLYDEALTCRMRPLSDAVVAFPRLVRDLGQSLGKRARLELAGESTAVDRDVLSALEAPLNQLLRNAIDHGIEPPAERRAAGKPETALIRLEAQHLAGMLEISLSDDGRGIDVERVRSAVVTRGLIDERTARELGDAEIYEFLFLPGFTLRDAVTEISGRGVGLDVVQSTLKRLRGSARIATRLGQGTTFRLVLPLTVAVVRTLIADIDAEPYAFPLAQIECTLSIAADEIRTLEGRQYFSHEGRQIGLVLAHQILGSGQHSAGRERLPLIVVSAEQQSYALVVDRLRDVRELVLQPLDPRLGKIKDIAAAALFEDGAPVLIVDMDDLIRSVEKLVSGGHLSRVREADALGRKVPRKRVLVVDDSFTVRELERKLIDSGGYEVEVAVDGMDGWNAVRGGAFDLVVTDIDMPRMDGIELVKLIRNDARLRTLPVMIVSYKDRQEDRQRGLDAGADYYLTKGSFQNEGLLQAVTDLIGEASA